MPAYNLRKRKRKVIPFLKAEATEDKEVILPAKIESSYDSDSEDEDRSIILSKDFIEDFIEDEFDTEKKSLSKRQKKLYRRIQRLSDKNSPSLTKILSSNLPLKDKIDGVKYYESLLCLNPDSLEHYHMSKFISEIYSINLPRKEASKYIKYHKEIYHVPTLSNVIQAYLPQSDKLNAIRYLENFHKTPEHYISERESYLEKLRGIMTREKYYQENHINLREFDEMEKKIKDKKKHQDIDLRIKILSLDVDDMTRSSIYEMYERMMNFPPSSSEYSLLREKLRWAICLPHRKTKLLEYQDPEKYCSMIYDKLNKQLYGLEHVKKTLVEAANNRMYNPNSKMTLALRGKPGLGKTSIAKALADALNLPFERISCGGLEDASIFKGTDNSWLGASPSIILKMLKKMNFSNGIILFDEIDKLSGHKGKQVQHALLHITDFTQNKEFQDLYINEFSHDLSNLWFIFAMNESSDLDSALLDRMNILDIHPYSVNEKKIIVEDFVLPKTLKEIGMKSSDIIMKNEAIEYFVKSFDTPSIRPLEKYLFSLLSDINLLKTFNGKCPFPIDTVPNFQSLPYEITVKTLSTTLSPKTKEVLPYFI
jgi:ATP-dependent Lon protease